MRAESRRLVQGGREETGKIPLEQAAQRPFGPVSQPGSDRYITALSGRQAGKKSGTAEGRAFVSLETGRFFCYRPPRASSISATPRRKPSRKSSALSWRRRLQ